MLSMFFKNNPIQTIVQTGTQLAANTIDYAKKHPYQISVLLLVLTAYAAEAQEPSTDMGIRRICDNVNLDSVGTNSFSFSNLDRYGNVITDCNQFLLELFKCCNEIKNMAHEGLTETCERASQYFNKMGSGEQTACIYPVMNAP